MGRGEGLHVSRINIISYAVVLGGAAALLTSTAVSQGGYKSYVGLQPTTPGASQSGHIAVSGTIRGGNMATPGNLNVSGNILCDGQVLGAEFLGDGSQLGNLNASNITSGLVGAAFLDPDIAYKDQFSLFTGITQFNAFVGVGRSDKVTDAESFGVGNNSNSFDGMYVRTSISGRPFYGYSAGGAVSAFHYVDSSDNNAWKLATSEGDKVAVGQGGQVAIGGNLTAARLTVVATDPIVRHFISTHPTSVPLRVENTSTADNPVGAIFEINSANGSTISATNLNTSGTSQVANFNSPSSTGQVFRVSQTGVGAPLFGTGGTSIRAENASYAGTAISASNTSPTALNPLGQPIRSYGVSGSVNNGHGYGIVGTKSGTGSGYGVLFSNGLGGSGTKSWIMDHPLKPETHILNHFCAEGPEPYNVYRGNVVTDAKGYALVELPDYFESINRDPSYHLTVIDNSDDFVMAKVVDEVRNNTFRIRTSKPGVKVSWRIEAVRSDKWVEKYGYHEVVEKKGTEVGRYISPELYGMPETQGWFYRPTQSAAAQPTKPKR